MALLMNCPDCGTSAWNVPAQQVEPPMKAVTSNVLTSGQFCSVCGHDFKSKSLRPSVPADLQTLADEMKGRAKTLHETNAYPTDPRERARLMRLYDGRVAIACTLGVEGWQVSLSTKSAVPRSQDIVLIRTAFFGDSKVNVEAGKGFVVHLKYKA